MDIDDNLVSLFPMDVFPKLLSKVTRAFKINSETEASSSTTVTRVSSKFLFPQGPLNQSWFSFLTKLSWRLSEQLQLLKIG